MIRTLVVDDDFRVCGIHAAYVSRLEGFQVAGKAHTVATALQAVRDLHPDFLLLDLYLPDGTGLEVLRKLTGEAGEDRPDAFLITAARDLSSARAAIKLGAVGYLMKPFGFTDLKERLTAYEAMRHQVDSLDLETESDQAAIDALFSAARPGTLPEAPAKVRSQPTLTIVRQTVREADHPISASEVAERTGISRTTAQRYLSHLVGQGILDLELRYGATGRPENRYRTRPPRN